MLMLRVETVLLLLFTVMREVTTTENTDPLRDRTIRALRTLRDRRIGVRDSRRILSCMLWTPQSSFDRCVSISNTIFVEVESSDTPLNLGVKNGLFSPGIVSDGPTLDTRRSEVPGSRSWSSIEQKNLVSNHKNDKPAKDFINQVNEIPEIERKAAIEDARKSFPATSAPPSSSSRIPSRRIPSRTRSTSSSRIKTKSIVDEMEEQEKVEEEQKKVEESKTSTSSAEKKKQEEKHENINIPKRDWQIYDDYDEKVGDSELMRFHRIQSKVHASTTSVQRQNDDDMMTIKCKLNGGTACGYTSSTSPSDVGPSLADEVVAMKSDDDDFAAAITTTTSTSSMTSSSSDSTTTLSGSSWKEELSKMRKSIAEQDEAEEETAAIHFLVNKLSGERNSACTTQDNEKIPQNEEAHLNYWTNELKKRGNIHSRHRNRGCVEEKNLQVFCVVTGHEGDPCQDKTWPARYRVNKYITSKVSILSKEDPEDKTILGSPVYVMSNEEDLENTVQAIGQDGEWISVISPEIEAEEAWARQRDGMAQPLVRLGEDLPSWPRTHLCRINKAPCKLRKSKQDDSEEIKQIQAWESVLALELDEDSVHIRVKNGDQEDVWGRLEDFVGLPVPPGVCRPNEEFMFCEEDKSCEEQCLLGGKCQNNADVTCGKDSDCSTFGPCVMSGKCDMNPSKTCRSDNDCKDEDSCRDFAGKCQGQDVICAEDSHCGKDGSTKCIVGGVCSGGVAGEPPKKCTSNADCDAPNICQTGGRCTLNSQMSCALDEDCKKTNSGKCKNGGSCSNDPAQLCITDAECSEKGGTCRTDGTCQKDEAMSCTIDADCVDGKGPCVSGGKCSEGEKGECTTHADCENGSGVCLKNGHCEKSTDITCNGEEGQCPESEKCKSSGACQKDMKKICKTDDDCGESGPCVEAEALSSDVNGEDGDGNEDGGDKDGDGNKDGGDKDGDGKGGGSGDGSDGKDGDGKDGDGKDGDGKDGDGKDGNKDGVPPKVPAAGKKGGLADLLNGKKKGGLGAALFMNLVAAAQASMGRRRRFRESDVNLRYFRPNIPDANTNPLEFKKSSTESMKKSIPSSSTPTTERRRTPPRRSMAGADSSSLFGSSSSTYPSSSGVVSAMSNPLYSVVGKKAVVGGEDLTKPSKE